MVRAQYTLTKKRELLGDWQSKGLIKPREDRPSSAGQSDFYNCGVFVPANPMVSWDLLQLSNSIC